MRQLKTHFNTSPAAYEAARGGHLHDRRRAIVTAALAGTAPLERVLEVGCGTGALLADVAAAFPGVTFTGIDVEAPMVEHATARHGGGRVSFACADVLGLAGEAAYDAVVSVDTIHHLPDHPAAFAAVRGLLRPGGRWVAIEPNLWHAYVTFQQERMRRAGFDESHFVPRRTEPLLRAAGFTVASRRYAHLYPAAVRAVPPALARVERVLERSRLLGGSVVYELVAT